MAWLFDVLEVVWDFAALLLVENVLLMVVLATGPV
jgi:hypothetical protein